MDITDHPRGPVIWTGLYAISIIATLAVLLLHDQWSEVSVRTWAPVFQAILSGLAIVAGFYVQAWKRDGDRRTAAQDAITIIVHVTRFLEMHTYKMRQRARGGQLTASRVKMNLVAFQGGVDELADIDLSLLPNKDALMKFLSVMNDLRGLSGVFTVLETQAGVAPASRLDEMYARVFKRRTALLELLGVPEERGRIPPD